jgi:predicted permease
MRPLRRFLKRLASPVSARRNEERLKEEIEEHLALQTAENIRAGLSPVEARRQALLKFGAVEAIKEDYRDRRGLPVIENLLRDIRFAIRQLAKNPAFAFTAILMLALGMAASVAIFAFVDAALIRPLPYRDPARLVGVYENIPLCLRCNLSYPDYLDWRRLNTVFTSLDVYESNGFAVGIADGVEQAGGANVTAGFFRTLGVAPVLGRDFQPGEDQPAAPRTVMLSYAAWKQRYGGSHDVLGQTVTLNGEANLIIGVLPEGFYFSPLAGAEFFTALHATSGCYQRRGCHSLLGVARLKAGVSVEAAFANTKMIARQLEEQYPDSNRGQGANVTTLTEDILGDIRPILLLLLGGAGLLLAIAGLNIANLLLVRVESRKREIAVRTALGGSAGRLFSQFVAEGAVLVAAGGALGVIVAGWLMRLLIGLVPKNVLLGMPYLQGIGFHPRVVLFAGAIAILSGALFSLAPISRISMSRMREGLVASSRGNSGTTWRQFGARLVVLEMAAAVVLLVGAGLLGQSLYRLLHANVGFQPERLAALRVSMPRHTYSTDPKTVAIEHRILNAAAVLPGVKSVAVTSMLPLLGGNTMWIRVPGRPYHGEHNEVSYREVSAGYFATLRTRLASGRYFTESDDASKPPVVIINRAFAEKYYPGEDAVGKQLSYAPTLSTPFMEVIGVVDDLHESPVDQESRPTMYVAFDQDPTSSFSVVVRMSADGQALLPAIAAAIRQLDPAISTFDMRTMEQRINDSPSAYLRRASAWLVGGFAALALLLSVAGLYGVVAYSVSQRTREIGVRMALGAERVTVYRLILSEAARLTVAGVLIGLGCSVAAANLIRGLLFGVDPWDWRTLLLVAVVLGISGPLASYLPARRAASINPVDALRAE